MIAAAGALCVLFLAHTELWTYTVMSVIDLAAWVLYPSSSTAVLHQEGPEVDNVGPCDCTF
jgi:hypothetical protein